MKELRTITITNGELFDNADIYTTEDGIVKLWLHSDTNHDAEEKLVDDSNTSVMDVIRDGGWEIVEETINAQDFANSIGYPCLFFAGNGAPGGQTIALLDDTALPFDLCDIEGDVSDGIFEANNLTHGDGANDWSFSDFRGNTIYKLQIVNDAETYEAQYAEWMGN